VAADEPAAGGRPPTAVLQDEVWALYNFTFKKDMCSSSAGGGKMQH
jgi:hypothetical protein